MYERDSHTVPSSIMAYAEFCQAEPVTGCMEAFWMGFQSNAGHKQTIAHYGQFRDTVEFWAVGIL